MVTNKITIIKKLKKRNNGYGFFISKAFIKEGLLEENKNYRNYNIYIIYI